MNFLKKILSPFNPWQDPPTAAELIQENIVEYQRQLVLQEAAAAYHQKMSEYYRESIQRLQTC